MTLELKDPLAIYSASATVNDSEAAARAFDPDGQLATKDTPMRGGGRGHWG